MYLGSYHGYDSEGHQLAQVGNVIGRDGTSEGWMVHLLHQPIELPDRYPDEGAAKAAAEAALDRPPLR